VKLILLSLLILTVIGFTEIQAQEETNEIPSWVKKNMVFWGDNLLDDKEIVNMLQWLIDSNIIELDNNVIVENTMSTITESELVVNMQKIIDGLNDEKINFENQIQELEEKNESLFDKAVTDDVLADLETMRVRANQFEAEKNDLKIQLDSLQAELDSLKQ